MRAIMGGDMRLTSCVVLVATSLALHVMSVTAQAQSCSEPPELDFTGEVFADYKVLQLGCPVELHCNNTSEQSLAIPNGSVPIYWMLRVPDLEQIGNSTGRYELLNDKWTLAINETFISDLGQYHCMLMDPNQTWYLVTVGLNVRGPYFFDTWEKYDTNTIIGLSALFGFLLLTAAIVILYHFRYRSDHSDSDRSSNSSLVGLRFEKLSQSSMGDDSSDAVQKKYNIVTDAEKKIDDIINEKKSDIDVIDVKEKIDDVIDVKENIDDIIDEQKKDISVSDAQKKIDDVIEKQSLSPGSSLRERDELSLKGSDRLDVEFDDAHSFVGSKKLLDKDKLSERSIGIVNGGYQGDDDKEKFELGGKKNKEELKKGDHDKDGASTSM